MLRFVTAIAALCLGFFLITSRQARQNAVVVFGPEERIDAQVAQWRAEQDGFARRDLAIFRACDIRNSAEIERRLSLDHGEFAVVVVSAAGQAAVRSTEPLSADRLFEWVDALPKDAGDHLGQN